MKRSNMAILTVAVVVIAVALVFSFVTLGDEGEDGDGRFDYTLAPVTEEMFEWSEPDEAREQLDDAVAVFEALEDYLGSL